MVRVHPQLWEGDQGGSLIWSLRRVFQGPQGALWEGDHPHHASEKGGATFRELALL